MQRHNRTCKTSFNVHSLPVLSASTANNTLASNRFFAVVSDVDLCYEVH